MTIYEVTCERFDDEYETAWVFGGFIDANSEDEAIDIFKELSDEYKEHFAEFQESNDVVGLLEREPKTFRILAYPIKILNRE